MPAQLVALNEGPPILLDKPILLLGRDLECDIRLDSRKISRRHCCIAQIGDRLAIRDLGSTNGVRVNGVRVVEGQLKAGDELTIGNFRYQVYWGDQLPSDPPRKPEAKAETSGPPPAPVERLGSTDKQPDEDEWLEESEEPVPLSEAASNPVPAPKGKMAPQVPPAGGFKAGPPVPPNPPTQILPDEMDLAPPSDVYPDVAKQPPGTGNSSIHNKPV
jgi:predicted component of type VI protein secretion system